MMKRKIEKTYIDNGFGFQVVLHNVPMIKVLGVWTPDINYNQLKNRVLWDLVKQPEVFSGNEVRFIRLAFDIPCCEFADRLNVKESTVLKWERAKEHGARINSEIEKNLRLFIDERLILSKDQIAYHNHINFKDLRYVETDC